MGGGWILPSEGVVAILWTFASVAIILTIGRLIIHWRKNKRYIWDDALNGLALITLLAFCSTYQVYGPEKYDMQLYDAGVAVKKPILDTNSKRLKCFNDATIVLFWCVIHFVKFSFLALYWTLFELSRKFRVAWWVVTVYTVMSFLATVLWSPVLAFRTELPEAVQDKLLFDMQIGWAALDIFGDIMLMALPLMMIQPLRMRLSHKIGLSVIFGLVLINIILELLRTIVTIVIDLEKFRGQGVVIFILQANLAVITCALPCYRGFLIQRRKVCNWTLPKIVMETNIEEETKPVSEGSSKAQGSVDGSLEEWDVANDNMNEMRMG